MRGNFLGAARGVSALSRADSRWIPDHKVDCRRYEASRMTDGAMIRWMRQMKEH